MRHERRLIYQELAASARRPEVKIVIPDVLKLQLVDDWENVTKHNQVRHPVSLVDGAGNGEDDSISRAGGLRTALTLQLVTLPRTPHVRQLLSQYKQYVEDTKQDRSA